MANNKEKLRKSIQKAPSEPGVYFFKDKRGLTLYIGKAANLKVRLKQYLSGKTYGPFISHMLNEAIKVEFKKTESEIEALILESQLIKKGHPKYNIMLRDDKQYFYVVFTKERFPKIFLTHQPRARGPVSPHPHGAQLRFARHGGPPVEPPLRSITHEYIGPFTDGTALKKTLRLLRRIFPYCTCKQKHNNFCLNYHIGKCLGICCLKENQNYNLKFKNYQNNIKAIKDILSGKKESLIKNLIKEMKKLGQEGKLEKAIELQNKISKLEKVFENAKIIREIASQEKVLKRIKQVFDLPLIPFRIEGYDISNIQGINATGSMVVFTNGQPNKNEYRKFKIRTKTTPDDTAMLKEILTRRFNHPEWQFPDLILIDGGKGQLNAAHSAIFNSQFSISKEIPIISLAKGRIEVFSSTKEKALPMAKLPRDVRNLIQHIDSEAHRFAITYYRKLHRKAI